MQKCVAILNVGDHKKNINILGDPKEKGTVQNLRKFDVGDPGKDILTWLF